MTTLFRAQGADFDGTPRTLWSRGNSDLIAQIPHAVNITGSRACTAYGQQIASDYAATLTAEGVTVLTGASYGIEEAAIRGTLAAHGAPIVVLPCGLMQTYPTAHTALIDRVVSAGGVVLSLEDPEAEPTRIRVQARNQWNVMATAGTLLVEAAQRSSAGQAVTMGLLNSSKPVGCVPGPVTSATSEQTNRLIAQRAASAIYSPAALLAWAAETVERAEHAA